MAGFILLCVTIKKSILMAINFSHSSGGSKEVPPNSISIRVTGPPLVIPAIWWLFYQRWSMSTNRVHNSDQSTTISNMMKFYLVLAAAAVGKQADAFSVTMQTFIPPPLKYNPSISSRVSIQLGSTTASATATLDEKTDDTPQQTKTLGLLTFDLGALYYAHMMCTSFDILS